MGGHYRLEARALVLMRQPSKPVDTSLPERSPRPEEGTVESAVPPARRRRAGVLVPLFSLRSESNWGVGDISDIPRFASFAAKAGLSVVQILPVNEGSPVDASPYAATSAFAIDPVYLSLDNCEDLQALGGRKALSPEHKEELAAVSSSPMVLWQRVRRLKTAVAHQAFQRFLRDEWKPKTQRARDLAAFQAEHRAWLDDHALFAVMHERLQKSWQDWPERLRTRTPEGVATFRREFADALLERNWLQWQLDLQWRHARAEAGRTGVALMGDMPFTVSADSSDVWAHTSLFRPDLRVGTPPDAFSSHGQDWGLPAYDWNNLRRAEFAWIRARAARAGELYSGYRVDHVIGLYRTYVRKSVDGDGGFWPANEASQISLGETILRVMRTSAEVIAEDLGTVPEFLRPSLDRLGVPGYRVLRWEKDGATFRNPADWPKLSVATNGTHDTDSTADWFEQLPTDERKALAQLPGLEKLAGKDRFDDEARDLLLAALYRAPSQLVITPFADLFGQRDRVNVPGSVSDSNWTYRLATPIETLIKDDAAIERLATLSRDSERSR